MSRLFPELDRDIICHILQDKTLIYDQDGLYTPSIEHLRDIGILTVQKREYIRCAYQDDFDFLERSDLSCEGEIELSPQDEEYYCPVCGDPIGDIEGKMVIAKQEISLNIEGIEAYIEEALGSLAVVDAIEREDTGTLELELKSGDVLRIVIPGRAGIRHHSSGMFFDEPTLYIIPSAIDEPFKTILDDRQFAQLADILSEPQNAIEAIFRTAAVPISGRRNLSNIERRFDEMLVRHEGRSWQFFEQTFIPALVSNVTENAGLAQRYLEKLGRLSGTIFADFCVPVGGAGVPDLYSIDKYGLMTQFLQGNAIGDAKCYVKSTLSYDDVIGINGHLDMNPTEASRAVVYVAGDDVASTAWTSALRLKQNNNGAWKIIIIPKYLLLELISELEVTHLLDL